MTADGWQSPPEVTAADAIQAQLLGAQLIDVRELDEWLAGHAPGAIHVPMSQFSLPAGALPPADPLIIVCRSGVRSGFVVAELLAAGNNAVNLVGGMQARQQTGGAVVHDDNTPGSVI